MKQFVHFKQMLRDKVLAFDNDATGDKTTMKSLFDLIDNPMELQALPDVEAKLLKLMDAGNTDGVQQHLQVRARSENITGGKVFFEGAPIFRHSSEERGTQNLPKPIEHIEGLTNVHIFRGTQIMPILEGARALTSLSYKCNNCYQQMYTYYVHVNVHDSRGFPS